MTEEKIINALKLHASEKSKCLDCPYYHEQACSYDMAIDALDLINRQKAEIEALIAGQETLQKALAEKAAEVERLKNDCFCISNERDAIGDCLNEAVEEAKAEAIKEFAERLKTEQSFYDGQETRIYLTEKDLDNLVKEMAGETE